MPAVSGSPSEGDHAIHLLQGRGAFQDLIDRTLLQGSHSQVDGDPPEDVLGDLLEDQVAELFAEDVVYDSTEIGDAVIVGRARLREYFDQVIEISDVLFEPERIVAAGEQVASVLTLRGRGELSGAPILVRLAQVATMRDGLIAHVRLHTDPADALAAVGAVP